VQWKERTLEASQDVTDPDLARAGKGAVVCLRMLATVLLPAYAENFVNDSHRYHCR
jgi:hypothetical protein